MAQSEAISWQCPYCKTLATIREGDFMRVEDKIPIYNDAELFYILMAITCLNYKCRKLSLNLQIKDKTSIPSSPSLTLSIKGISPAIRAELEEKRNRKRMDFFGNYYHHQRQKLFPDYIPRAILDDYEEACEIVNLSPKASATLSRRCLQTIIREFWGIKNKGTLNEEIKTLEVHADMDSNLISAFHDLREIGNIGAHMDKDVNLIIEVDPHELRVDFN